MVKSVDDAVGKIIEAIEELNLADNTMIVFFSDNGGSQLSYQGACDPLRMGKGYLLINLEPTHARLQEMVVITPRSFVHKFLSCLCRQSTFLHCLLCKA